MTNIFQSKLESLVQQSADTLSIFDKAINDLTKINTEIVNEKAIRSAKIVSIENELNSLDIQESKNTKVLENIKKFFD